MASHPDIEDVRAAVSSTATCSAATASILKELLLSETEPSPATKPSATKPSATKGPRSAPSSPATGGKSGPSLALASQLVLVYLSFLFIASLATHVFNATQKALGEAAKPQTSQT